VNHKSWPIGRVAIAIAALSVSGCQHVRQIHAPDRWRDRPPSADADYLARFHTVEKAGGSLSYDILAPVDGTATDLAFAKPSTLSPKVSAALGKVTDYAARTNSSALLIWYDGKLIDEHYFGDTQAETALASKSLAKPLSAVAIGRAIQLGKIRNLDQSVADYITEWRGTPKARMTIRHVLSMETGLLEQSFVPGPDNPWSRAYLDPYHERYIVDEYPLTNPPGTLYGYSNAAADLVAIIIARATGERYDEFVARHVLKPIGAAGGTIWLNRKNGSPHSGCCINLPARSWLKLAILLLDDGRVEGQPILPRNFVAEMRKASAHNPHYGLGVWLGQPYAERRGFMGPNSPAPKVWQSAPYHADDLFLFDGNGNQTIYIVPSRKLVILRMGASPPTPVEWDNSFMPNMMIDGLAAGR
jgi:CubicO group peptidase (beta-lactamase class C family)